MEFSNLMVTPLPGSRVVPPFRETVSGKCPFCGKDTFLTRRAPLATVASPGLNVLVQLLYSGKNIVPSFPQRQEILVINKIHKIDLKIFQSNFVGFLKKDWRGRRFCFSLRASLWIDF